ncbi:MAG: sugar ABC transporter ATP-binding protein [Planctomycetota bacterium]
MIEFRDISKHFGGVQALADVSLTIERGTVHVLMGENGAGKSTLGKVLGGIHRPDGGLILLDGEPVRIADPAAAADLGIAIVHQELAYCPDLSVAENVSLHQLPARAGIVDRRELRARATELLAGIDIRLDVDRPMRELSTAQVQLVQIATAVGSGARVIVFDEPTSSLGDHEAESLMTLIERLRDGGLTAVYVSHRMPEVMRLADRISVLRDGRHVGTIDRADTTEDELVRMMVGRSVAAFERSRGEPGAAILEVDGLSSRDVRDISFSVRAGEIVGMAGLVGSGRSETVQAIFGLDPTATGRVCVDGNTLSLRHPAEAIAAGVALVPEDRKLQGLQLEHPIRTNVNAATLGEFAAAGFVKQAAEHRRAEAARTQLDIRTADVGLPAGALSGGNQQKVALAKWLGLRESAGGLKLLIVDEPTRGVDIGAKAGIHQILADLVGDGVAVLVVSSELPELLGLCDRVLVMRGGRLVGEFVEKDQARVLHAMTGSD